MRNTLKTMMKDILIVGKEKDKRKSVNEVSDKQKEKFTRKVW